MSRRLIAVLLALVGTAVPANAQSIFSADLRLFVTSTQVVSNTIATVISGSPAMLYAIEGFNTGSLSPTFVKLYNGVPAACGTGTPQARYVIGASSAPPLVQNVPNGDAYGAGLTMCVTGGYADSDTTAPATGAYTVNLHFKKQQ